LTRDPVAENLRLAIACGVEPALALVVALASSGAKTPQALFELIATRRTELEALMNTPTELALNPLEPELAYEPELACMRLEEGDHEIRGRRLFGELLGKKSFFQVAALEIAGLELSDSDAELLEHAGVVTQIGDPRVWPLGITRRAAAHTDSFGRALVAGVASFCTPKLAVLPVARFIGFLHEVSAATASGTALEDVLDRALAAGQRIPGVGRPTLRGDERVGPLLDLMRRFGRDQGPSVMMTRDIDAAVERRKGLKVNSAGYQAALLRDLGFSPDAAAAFCVLYFVVPVLAHAVYPAERRVAAGGANK
jgi:hypothetical protein